MRAEAEETLQPYLRSPVLPHMPPSSRPPSPFAMGILYAGGIAGIYALFIAFSAATGQRFEIAEGGRGVPLPHTWFHAILFVAIGAALWALGRAWDRERFVAVRKRRPWLAPTVGTLVVFPATVMLIFVLVK